MPTKAKSKSETEQANPDYIRMYYEHQYDRMEKHEGHALNISNIVLTISALIITFGFNNKQSFGSILILFLPVIIIVANMFSILFINDRSRWIAQHQIRAKRVLEDYMPELYVIDKETIIAPKKWTVGRSKIQNLIHYLFIFLGVILLVLFVLEVFGVSIV